ncbi:MAG: sugar nucleotide-binding protein [Chlorobi bacterium]|nr:sugar nucleotide-binding protein [Chlorobiota bacterium]
MKILITGASGFVGWNGVQYFIDRGCYVQPTFHSLPHYLHNHSERFLSPVHVNVRDGSMVEDVVSRVQPDIILHFAALARPQQKHSGDILHQINVVGTANVASAAAHTKTHLIFLSTDLVYPADAGLVNESSSVAPSDAGAYASSKLAAEEQVKQKADCWTIIRPTLMFGHGTPRSNSFTQFLEKKWKKGEPAPVFSDQIRSFLYVGDLLKGIERVVQTSESHRETYVCGGSEDLSRADFALRYAHASGVDRSLCAVMKSTELEGYVGGPSDIRLDTSKLQAIGWTPQTLEESFMQMNQ